MMFLVTFNDGTTRLLEASSVRVDEQTVRFRTTLSSAYPERWVVFPLVGVRSWERKS